jgi:hypothetical protein
MIEDKNLKMFIERATQKHGTIQKRDEIKNIYCKENNIVLYRFNYKEINDIDKKLDEIFI